MSFFHLLMFCAWLYVSARCILPLALPLRLRLILSLLVLACALKSLWLQHAFGAIPPDQHRLLLAAGGLAQGAVIMWAVLCLLRDALTGLLYLARLWKPAVPRIPLTTGQWSALLVVAALLITAEAVREGLRVPRVKQISITLPRLPAALDGLRIVQLSDLHISTAFPREWVETVTAEVNALKPDIILITGDTADGTPQSRKDDVAPLAGLRAPLGVFACLGNHEYYWGSEEWVQTLRGMGIRVLINEHAQLNTRGQNLVIAGTTDRAALKEGLPGPDIQKAFQGAPDDALRILLAHRPEMLTASADHAVDLQLSGHTHSGQMFFLAPLVAYLNAGYLVGNYTRGQTRMYTSPGTGLWGGVPLRLFRPSEITEITLCTGRTSEADR